MAVCIRLKAVAQAVPASVPPALPISAYQTAASAVMQKKAARSAAK
jgi:hypothetical protein